MSRGLRGRLGAPRSGAKEKIDRFDAGRALSTSRKRSESLMVLHDRLERDVDASEEAELDRLVRPPDGSDHAQGADAPMEVRRS